MLPLLQCFSSRCLLTRPAQTRRSSCSFQVSLTLCMIPFCRRQPARRGVRRGRLHAHSGSQAAWAAQSPPSEGLAPKVALQGTTARSFPSQAPPLQGHSLSLSLRG